VFEDRALESSFRLNEGIWLGSWSTRTGGLGRGRRGRSVSAHSPGKGLVKAQQEGDHQAATCGLRL
jgi:hypothetical protein